MATDAEPHYLETLNKDLALVLGDAVWAFARIEWLTYEYIGQLTMDRVDEFVGDLNFRHRTSILRRIVERRDASREKKDRALTAIKEAEKLADKRNIIVHNPWRIWIDLDAKDFMMEIQNYSRPNKKLDLEGLRQFVDSAVTREAELKEALNALKGSPADVLR